MIELEELNANGLYAQLSVIYQLLGIFGNSSITIEAGIQLRNRTPTYAINRITTYAIKKINAGTNFAFEK